MAVIRFCVTTSDIDTTCDICFRGYSWILELLLLPGRTNKTLCMHLRFGCRSLPESTGGLSNNGQEREGDTRPPPTQLYSCYDLDDLDVAWLQIVNQEFRQMGKHCIIDNNSLKTLRKISLNLCKCRAVPLRLRSVRRLSKGCKHGCKG